MKKIAVFIASIVFVLSGFFLSPAPLAFAQTANTPDSLTVDTNIENALSSGCSNASLFSSECALSLFYDIILQPSFWLVGVAANILDFFLGYSLDSNAYRAEFVQKGWALIRDISNVAFIFTLLYLAIKHILGSSSKKYIPTLIIVALLLNFSLFFTKVVIDAGNILARAFYNSIVIENDQNYEEGEEGYKSITLGIVDKINPQQLLSSTMIGLGGSVSGQYNSATNQFEGPVTPVISGRAGIFFTVFILIVIVNLVLTWTFLSVALLFVGRVIGLWFSMIFSPIAFITLAVPGSSGFVKQMSFDTWKDTVLKLAFMAPIFIFFLYLTISFLSIFVASQILPEGGDPFLNLMKIFIPFIFIIVLLQIAKKTADEMAGQFGGMVKSIVGKAAGMLAGGALGATSFAARGTLGRLASRKLSSGNYNERISGAQKEYEEAKKSGNISAQAAAFARIKRLEATKSTLSSWKDSSWDIRNANKSKMLGGAVGGVAGFLGKQGFGRGMEAFGGKDFGAGKGSSNSRKKYEEDQEKIKVKKAEELSKIERNELPEQIMRLHRRGMSAQQILDGLGVSSNIEVLTKKINDMEASGDIDTEEWKKTDKELKILESIRDGVSGSEGNTKKLEKFIKDGGGSYIGTKATESERREQVATRVQNDIWYDITTGENEYTADKIRKGEKSKSDDEKLIDQIKKVVKKGDDESEDTPKDEPKSETDKPKDGNGK